MTRTEVSVYGAPAALPTVHFKQLPGRRSAITAVAAGDRILEVELHSC